MATEPPVFESSPSDAALVARAVGGETEAYDLLIARHQERWLLYACGTIRDRDAAEDVLQEALVRAYKSLSQCRDRERFGAWFFQILVNQCRTASRKDARRTRRWQWGKPLLQEEAEHRSSSNLRFAKDYGSLSPYHNLPYHGPRLPGHVGADAAPEAGSPGSGPADVATSGAGIAHVGAGIAHVGAGIAHVGAGIVHVGAGIVHVGAGIVHVGACFATVVAYSVAVIAGIVRW